MIESQRVKLVADVHSKAQLRNGEVVDLDWDEYVDADGVSLPSSWLGYPLFWGLDGAVCNDRTGGDDMRDIVKVFSSDEPSR